MFRCFTCPVFRVPYSGVLSYSGVPVFCSECLILVHAARRMGFNQFLINSMPLKIPLTFSNHIVIIKRFRDCVRCTMLSPLISCWLCMSSARPRIKSAGDTIYVSQGLFIEPSFPYNLDSKLSFYVEHKYSKQNDG